MSFLTGGIFKVFQKKDKEGGSKEPQTKIGSPQVRIVIKRLMGNMPVVIAEFDAMQDRDSDYNLKLINAEYDFKEDITIANHRIIDSLKYKLDIMNTTGETPKDTRNKRLEIIKKAVLKQEKKIKELKNGIETKPGTKVKQPTKPVDTFEDDLELPAEKDSRETVPDVKTHTNVIDEEYKLAELKALRFCIENESEGSYEEINVQGARQMSFLLMDGVLYPYKHASTNVTLYPDIGSKRKIYKDKQDIIDAEYLDENRGAFSGLWKNMGQIVLAVLIVANIYWAMELSSDRAEFTDMVDTSAFGEMLDMAGNSYLKCADVQAECTELNEEFIKLKDQCYNEDLKPDGDSGTVDLQ